MANEIYFLAPFIAVTLIVLGLEYKRPTPGILGGLLLFLYGVMLLISPISDLPDTHNLVIGAVAFGVGAWFWVVGAMEQFIPILNRTRQN